MPVPSPVLVRNPDPLPPDGAFQSARLPAALAPDYVLVDERDPAAWVDYVARLSERITYFDLTDAPHGDWSAFYRGQPAVVVARMLGWPTERLAALLREHRERIEERDTPTGQRRQLLGNLFDLVASAALTFADTVAALPPPNPLLPRAAALVEHQLLPAVRRWIAYHQAGLAAGFIDQDKDLLDDHLTAFPLDGPLRTVFELDSLLGADAGAILPEAAVYGSDPDPDVATVHAVGHAFFYGTYETVTNVLLHQREPARAEWDRLLNDPGHAPHLTLLLAFLETRRRQQALLNGLTDRHLDFYYRRVLRLLPRPAAAARAFLAIETRRGAEAYLPAGTVFRGGKDPVTKIERRFLSREALSAGPAVIAERRTLYRPVAPATDPGRLLATTELPEDDPSWHPFNPTAAENTAPARVGLAIASHYLLLRGGNRTVELALSGPGTDLLINRRLRAYLTTEDGWWEQTVTVNDDRTIALNLDPAAPPIVPYLEDTHELGLGTDKPTLRLELMTEGGSPNDYAELRSVRLRHIDLGIVVRGLRDLAVTGAGGAVDPAEAFFPFGAQPRGGETLTVGHPEAFSKRAQLTLSYRFKNYLRTADRGRSVTGQTLVNGTFVRQAVNYTLARSGNWSFDLRAAGHTGPNYGETTNYTARDSNGFVRLRLNGDWGHDDFPTRLATWAADTRPVYGSGGKGLAPAPPYSPEFDFLELGYRVNDRVGTEEFRGNGDYQLFHLTPFGHAHPPVSDGRIDLLPDLLPQADTELDAGALYLGIEGWRPGSQLSLLLAVEDGTADPLLRKPEDHLRFHYLHRNEWTDFPAGKLSDGTDGLLRSGLLRLDLPADTVSTNTRFGDVRTWLRISVGAYTGAVNYLRGIHANGVEVVQDMTEEATGSAAPLPAGTIGKLLVPVSAVKGVEQPYPTFGQRTLQDRDGYFTDRSERLRHKDRAITEWDVEKLVLGAFPAVERVVCLQHVRYEPGDTPADSVTHELAAGHLTVLPIGRATSSRADALRPYVSLTLREEITDFLRRRLSCHATLHVRNPLFEEVSVTAWVRYRTGTDENWAGQQIQADLIRHISPWTEGGLEQLRMAAEVHRSHVVNFLEELPYVDYVRDLVLHHAGDPAQSGRERLRPSRLVAVLVSAATHSITPLPADDELAVAEVCANARRRARGGSRVTVGEIPAG